MHPISAVIAITKGQPTPIHVGFNSHDAEEVYERTRLDGKVDGLVLIQNAAPRLTCSPATDAAQAEQAAKDLAARKSAERDAERSAARRKVAALRADLKAAEDALKA